MSPEQEPNDDLLAQLEACERRVWDALVDGDMDADQDALDDDFLGIYADGFSAKTDHVQQLANGSTVDVYQLSGLRTLSLGSAHAVLSYRADFRRANKTSFEAMYVSSIWRRKGVGWVNILSQDTPATD